jgi:WD40 repeat protein
MNAPQEQAKDPHLFCCACGQVTDLEAVAGWSRHCANCGRPFPLHEPRDENLPLAEPFVPDEIQTADLASVDTGEALQVRTPSVTDQPPPPSLGQLGRFQLRAALGQGGFGMVYRAYDPVLDREVALKVPKFPPDQPEKVERFLREAKAAARLRHPNIVAVFESGKVGEDYFIASEFVEGVPLSVRLTEDRPRHRQAAQWVRDLALALAYAHGEGIIHRDVKPANIMIDKRGRAQLMDFGLAKRLAEDVPVAPAPASTTKQLGSQDAGMTSEGDVLGTPAYMAPEQARGEVKAVGPHSDQYSLGVVLYELLTGKRPFQGAPQAILAQVANPQTMPPLPRRLKRSIPRDLQAICLKAIAKDVTDRYATMADFAVDLQLWLKEELIHARRPTWLGQVQRWCWRHVVPLCIAGLALFGLGLAALLGGQFAAYRSRTAEELKRRQESIDSALARVREEQWRTEQEKQRTRDEQQRTQQQKQQTEQERLRTQQEHRQTQRWIGQFFRDRGLRLIEHQESGQGLVLLGKSLEIAAELSDRDLQAQLRGDLARSVGQVAPLRHVVYTPGKQYAIWVVSREGNRALAGGKGWLTELWSLGTERMQANSLGSSTANLRAAAFSPNGRLVLTAAREKTARLWKTDTSKQLKFDFKHPAEVRAAAFSPNGQYILTASDKRAYLWNAATGKPFLGEPKGNSGGRIAGWWEVTTGTRLPELLQHDGVILAVAFSPDGQKLLTAGEDRTARLWETATGRPLGKRLVHPGAIACVAFSPDGKMIVTGCDDHHVRLWDAATGQPVGPTLSHTGGVSAVAFSPDGHFLLTGSVDRTARLWDAHTGKMLGPPLWHPGEVEYVAFRPNGLTALTCAPDGMRIWDMAALCRPLRSLYHLEEVFFAAFQGSSGLNSDKEATLILGPDPMVADWSLPLLTSSRSAADVCLSLQVLTGLDADREGRLAVLNTPTWQERRRRLERQAGQSTLRNWLGLRLPW